MNELHSQYSEKGLVVLGVPCNQFGHQVGIHLFFYMNFNIADYSVLYLKCGGQVVVNSQTASPNVVCRSCCNIVDW